MRKSTIIAIILFVISVGVAAASWYIRNSRKEGTYPVITMEDRVIEVPVGADDSAILEGVIANDAEDGDLSGRLIVEGMSRFISKGRRSAKIAVVDSSEKVTEVTREVVYTDYESPKFSLSAPLILPVGTSKLDGMITAQDMIDGDISRKIKLHTDVSDLGEREGAFRVTFSCSNSLGDTSEIPLTIIYESSATDKSAPKITLTDYLIYMKQNEWVNLWDLVESLTADKHTFVRHTESDGSEVLRIPGTEPEEEEETEETTDNEEDTEEEAVETAEPEEKDPNVVEFNDFEIIYGGLNYSVPGTYEVFFTYTDSEERTGRTCVVVVVEEAE